MRPMLHISLWVLLRPHLDAAYQTSFESLCLARAWSISARFEININGIEFAKQMVPVWMVKFIEYARSCANFIIDEHFDFAELAGPIKIYIIIDWMRRFVIVGETCMTLDDRAGRYIGTMRKVLFSNSGAMIPIGMMRDWDGENRTNVRDLERKFYQWRRTHTTYKVFNFLPGEHFANNNVWNGSPSASGPPAIWF